MNAILGLTPSNKPRIVRQGGSWFYYAAMGGLWPQRNNARAYDWVKERNRAKPNRCPVPQDDVCDYGRGITLEDNPGRNPHGPFN